MTKLLIAAVLFSMVSCAHGGGRPAYCKREFSFKDPAFDLDKSGTVTTADFAIYLDKCEG